MEASVSNKYLLNSKRIVLLRILLSLMLWSAPHALVAQKPPVGGNPQLLTIEKFMMTAYPEMWREATRVSLTTDAWLKGQPWRTGWYGVNVEKAQRPPGVAGDVIGTTTPCVETETPSPSLLDGCEIPFKVSAQPLWQGLFYFSDSSGGDFSVKGTVYSIHSKNLALKQVVNTHPEWTDARIAEAIKNAGAKYGPADKEELLACASLRKYAPYFGNAKVSSVRFCFRTTPVGQYTVPQACLAWQVEAKGPLMDAKGLPGRRKQRVCGLTFEPFEGSLVGMGCNEKIVEAGRQSR